MIPPEAVEQEPTPEEAVIISEELELALSRLDDKGREIIELAMQNVEVDAISIQVSRSVRTIRRTIQQFRESLEQRLVKSA